MSGNSSPDYKALLLKAAEEIEQLKDEKQQAEERERHQRERNRPTTFPEFIQLCHDRFWRPLRAQTPSCSTTGTIPAPIGKVCPLRLRPWSDCEARQREIFGSVCRHLQPAGEDAPRLFMPLNALESLSQSTSRQISSEKDLDFYEQFAAEDPVRMIIDELCKIPEAREEFNLGNGIRFDNHANALDKDNEADAGESSTAKRSKPDQFCIYRIDGYKSTLLTTIEYKPPHKLSVTDLRLGLHSMEFWRDVVQPDHVPTEEPEKSRYHAKQLVGSPIVQGFHVMIQEGLEYSCLTNGLVDVLLWVPYDDPTTLYYDLGEPGMYETADIGRPARAPMTRVERTLCLCLMSCRHISRDRPWRNSAMDILPRWRTSYDSDRSQISVADSPRDSSLDESIPELPSPTDSSSDYHAPVSPVNSGPQVTTRAAARCAPPSDQHLQGDSSDSDAEPAAPTGRKRRLSQVSSSSSTQLFTPRPRANCQGNQSGQSRSHDALYCTQKCLLGLQQGGAFDPECPNTKLHMLGRGEDHHLISAADLVKQIKAQLDQNPEHNCAPIGPCGATGVPFKITCATFGYTIVGKGTTSGLWGKVSREAEVYTALKRVQGSAVPVFLGAINLAQIYFVHRAGSIRHMLLMGWGGESVGRTGLDRTVQHAISQSEKEIRRLGVVHHDLRQDNILWNAELRRALIIDFDWCTFHSRLQRRRSGASKRLQNGPNKSHSKRVREM
ncbi:hypothetical protein POX_g09199 [Penicillium oxalicum]|uniref:hypothetical protein n=1 Tax=Penicillium oxalicum TaxID=69781 RepID=UPI0020B79A6F|nr:hypothetical protein POX_g09199 [Penicillium oxalicum]KAI2786805.1 hypothetical protein POX_g09199 [Penicillium oxalicum]